MTPTNRLRFVEREISQYQMITHRKVLQQWWEDHEFYNQSTQKFYGEWRDVPLEVENDPS